MILHYSAIARIVKHLGRWEARNFVEIDRPRLRLPDEINCQVRAFRRAEICKILQILEII